MAIRARLRIEGLAEAMERTDAVGQRARAPEPALRSPGTLRDLQDSERRKFQRGRWPRVTPKWAAEKRRRGLDPRPMRATGLLESALTNATHGVRRQAFNRTLVWGIRPGRSDIYYAQALAKGVGNPPKPRRMVVIDKVARERIAARVQRFIAYGFTD